MKTVYLLGYQPIDIISKEYRLIDLVNHVVSDEAIIGKHLSLPEALLDTLKTLPLDKDDKVLTNSYRCRDLLPFCPIQHTVLYDPPYLSSAGETSKCFREISGAVGSVMPSNCYLSTANSLRSMIAGAHGLPPSVYFNALTLLSDLNHSDAASIEKYLLDAPKSPFAESKHRAIFFGDPIDPAFFDTIAAKGVEMISYLPYETFIQPVKDVVKYYSTNMLYDPIMSIAIELKRIIREKHATMLILNPGILYLTSYETKYLLEQLSPVLPIYVLPGNYKGVDISVE